MVRFLTCVSNKCAAAVLRRSLPAPVLQRFVLEIKADLENIASCVSFPLCACAALASFFPELYPPARVARLHVTHACRLELPEGYSYCVDVRLTALLSIGDCAGCCAHVLGADA